MKNLTFKAAMLNDSRTTVNRQSTDGQSQRHYKKTPLSKRWKVLMTLVFLFTFAIGNVWAATEVRFLSANKNDANENFAAMSTSSNTTQLVGSGTAKLIAIGSAGLNDADKQIGYRSDSRLDIVFKFDGTASLDIYVNANGSSKRSFELRSFSSTKALSAIIASDYSSATKVTSNVSVTGEAFSTASSSTDAGKGSLSSGKITMSSSGGIKISYSSLAAGYYVFKSTGSSSSYIYGFDATVSGSDPVAVTGISLAPASATIKVGKTVTLVPTITPSNATDKAVTWAVKSGSSYASVDANGKVTGNAVGTAVVTATAHDGSGVTQDVTVKVTASSCPSSGELFAITVTSSSTVRPPRATDSSTPGWLDLTDYADISGFGEAKAGNKATGSDKGGISSTAVNLDGNDGVFWIALDCELEEGDVIEASVTGNTVYLTPDCSRASGISLATGTESKYTITGSDKLVGESNIYFWKGGGNAKIASLTITRPAPPTSYTVTIDPNGGSYASTPDGWTYDDVADKYTTSIASGTSFTAPAGLAKGTDDLTWKDGNDNDVTFPVSITDNITFVAQWAPHAASSDATLSALSVAGCTLNETFDPATTEYTISLPFYGVMPAANAVTATKDDANAADPEVSISGNVITVHCVAEKGASVKDYTITVNIAAAPTASSSINIEQLVLDNGKSYDIVSALTAANIVTDGRNGLDSLNDVGKTNRNYAYLGLKLKKTADIIKIVVPADNVLNVKFGNVGVALTTTINGAAGPTVAKKTDGNSSTFHLDAVAYVREIVFHSPETQTVTLQQVKIGADVDPITLPWLVTYDAGEHGTCATTKETWKGTALTLPVVTPESGWNFEGWKDDKDNSVASPYTPIKNVTLTAQYSANASTTDLAAMTYSVDGGAATAVGYRAGTYTYNVNLPYANYTSIKVTPTPISGASIKDDATKVLTVSSLPGAATFTVVGSDGAEQLYTVNFTRAPKDGTCIVKADLAPGSSAASITATSGAYKDADNIAINVAKDLKLGGTGAYVKVAVKDTYFQDGDVVEITLASDKNASAWLQIFADEGTTLVAEMTSGVSKASPNYLTISGVPANTSALYLYRTKTAAGNMNPYPTSMAVLRAMNPKLKSITIDGTKINVTSTTVSETLPYGANLTAVTPEYYWNGAGTAVVTTNGGNWAWGENTYVLTDKDGDATTYTITLTEAEHYVAQIGTTGYTSLTAAVDAARANDVVKLLDNVDLTTTGLTIAKNMTLDLNGFNIKAGEQIDNDIVVPAGVKLTLVDNSEGALGKIYTEEAYTGAETGYGVIRVAGELLMQSGNIYAVIDSDPANLGQFAVALGAGGKVTIEGGQIKAGWYAIANNGNNTGSTIVVKGGELISTADYAIYNPAKESTVSVSGGVVYGAAGAIAMNRGELTVTGGTITSKGQGSTGTWGDGTGGLGNAAIAANGRYESVSVEISGGTVIAEGDAIMITNGTVNPVEVAISGGQFSEVVPAEYCADGFAPVTTPNAQGKYEVIAAGVIRGAAVQDAEGVYYYTLDNGVTIYSSQSDGRLYTSSHISTSSNIEPCGGAEGGYNVNQSKILLQFPVNVKEFTLYGANSSERTISTIHVSETASADYKIKIDANLITGTYTNTKDGNCQTLTAAFNDANIIPANYYVLVTFSGTANIYRVLYTEAECTTPVINSTNAIRAKEGEEATVSVDATAIGASYTWYRCDNELGAYPQLIAGATKASYKFTKAAGNEYFKVVVGCNCSAETDEAIITAEEWYQVDRVNVTGYTEWSWAGVYDDADAGPQINQAQKGLVLASYIDAPDFNKLEGNNSAYVYRKNDYPAYQGTSLKFTTEIPGMLIIDASYTNSGNKIAVNGHDLGELPKNHAADFKLAVPAGDVTITSTGMRIWAMKFDPKFSNYAVTDNHFNGYTRNVTEGRYGTICLPKAGVMTGAELYEVAYYDDTYEKIFLDEVLNGEMVAGRPYIFLTKEGVDKIAVFYTDEENATAGDYHGLFGSYTKINLAANNHIYILKDNRYYFVDSDNVYCGENRAYFKMGVEGGISGSYVAPAPGRRRTSIGAGAPAVATGVEDVQGDNVQCTKVLINGELFIIRGEKMYDAKGQLVK